MIQIQDTNTNTLHTIGQIVTEYKPTRNAFVDTLVNRIAIVLVTHDVGRLGSLWQLIIENVGHRLSSLIVA